MEQELPTVPKHLNSPTVFSGVRVVQSFSFLYIVFSGVHVVQSFSFLYIVFSGVHVVQS